MTLRGTFKGEFYLDRPLTTEHLAYLASFAHSRRMKRSVALLENAADPVREAVGLPLGPEGAYYVGSTEYGGQDFDSPSVLDSNYPPQGQPGLWCQWIANENGTAIKWQVEMSDKIIDPMILWLQYLIDHFISPWGYHLNGTVHWKTDPYPFGSEMTMESRPAISSGDIVVTDNEIAIQNEKLEWVDENLD